MRFHMTGWNSARGTVRNSSVTVMNGVFEGKEDSRTGSNGFAIMVKS